MKPRDYDSTVARMAGNIAPALIKSHDTSAGVNSFTLAAEAVSIARAIIAETKRTEPTPESDRQER